MNQEQPVQSGILLFSPQGKIVLKKTWSAKYCLLFNASHLGIERLEVYDSIEEYQKKHSPPRMYTLENCIKIAQNDPSTNTFQIITKTWCLNLATTSQIELAKWITALQSIAFKTTSSTSLSSLVPSTTDTNPLGQFILEDNELYCSSGEGIFSVKLCPSEASTRCGLEPKNYILVITSTATLLQDCHTNKTLFTWPHRYIRRYGYRDGKFTFEAGRKCDSGEGSFHLEHSNQQEIFNCLSSKMKSMRKMLNRDESLPTSTSSSIGLDCGDNQFHAALSMEARSRSPLPPSPGSSTKLRDVDSKPNSYIHPLLHSNTCPNMPKPKPHKPPRKPIEIVKPSTSDYEPICGVNYDKVEVRNEAWKTLGETDITHNENIKALDKDDNLIDLSSWSIKQNSAKIDTTPFPPVSKIISKLSIVKDKDDNDENYDKLQFFGSTSKLNTSSYKQVLAISVTQNQPESSQSTPVNSSNTASWNDYEEIRNIESARLVSDDSHMGYGIIRKQSAPQMTSSVAASSSPPPIQTRSSSEYLYFNEETQTNVPHQVVNDKAYAIISKPKRV